MIASTDRMVNLTNQLLAYAQGGKYRPVNIAMNEFVANTLPVIRHMLGPEVGLEMDLSEENFLINADLTQMQMVISEVLTNASEAIEGKGHIQIITRKVEIDREPAKSDLDLSPGLYACLVIKDDGTGMNEETRRRIFEPFFTTKFQGRGLGMAAAYGITKNHDGSIFVDSEPAKGTKVSIYLPVVEEKVKVLRETSPEITFGTGTILVIEDEKIVMDVSLAMLEKLGYHTLPAHTGHEAIEIAERFDGVIDLALLDIKLPDMEGGQVFSSIKKIRPSLKVMVCSGYSIDGPAQEILDAGAEDFIQKPFTLPALSLKLKRVLAGEH
jgi:two-component system, cell cycle sensor histidine kinase and response regulator CckA